MTIYFLVAGTGSTVNGGTRIIYEHANRLSRRGHDVCLWHVACLPLSKWRHRLRALGGYLMDQPRSRNFPGWFKFDEAVRREYRFFPSLPKIHADDRLVATYFKTHELIASEMLHKFRCFNFIQGHETSFASNETLHRHWKSKSFNIVISKWLKKLVEEVSGQSYLVPNAIDFDFFNEESRAACLSRPNILFCSMRDPAKGAAQVVNAFNILDARGFACELVSFGDCNPAELGLRRPCEFHRLPSQERLRELYRTADVFVNASRSEGWGLTLAEATACGAALVVSDIAGHYEFARPGISAVFFELDNANELADKLESLCSSPEKIAEFNRNAKKDLAPFTWEAAVDAFELALFPNLPENSE